MPDASVNDGLASVIPFKPPKDPVLERLEADKAFWYHELRQASAEYMGACWKLAVYKQAKETER